MTYLQKEERLHNRPLSYPVGSLVGIQGERINIDLDGSSSELPHAYVAFGENDRDVIESLMTEVLMLRKLVKEMMRRSPTPIVSANEFNRSLTSLANKIGEDPDILRELLTPYLEELFNQMLSKGQNIKQARSRHQGYRHRSGGGH